MASLLEQLNKARIAGTYSGNTTQLKKSFDNAGQEAKHKELTKAAIGDMLQKGMISDRLASSYNENQLIKLSKTGKELKDKIPSILTELITESTKIITQMTILETEIGTPPTDDYYNNKIIKEDIKQYPSSCCYPPYENGSYGAETDTMKLCNKYNSLSYMLGDILVDIKTLQILKESLEDSKSYNLTVSQLIALQF